jgi:hypothetical protein
MNSNKNRGRMGTQRGNKVESKVKVLNITVELIYSTKRKKYKSKIKHFCTFL